MSVVHIRESDFLKKIYDNFVGTSEIVRNREVTMIVREVSIQRGSTVFSFFFFSQKFLKTNCLEVC